ncbi:hypothetical protein FH972_026502 [Carpinus fangiana]|uniref:tRNA (guanine(10)-N(2))-methyltransferase n=1 Tax=Carpinus fangiana TaxID=176857 RepID=A0A5N6L4N2_9ROSI|nr:hypothetical protein FH972_026502 [Carpinus fangiana]
MKYLIRLAQAYETFRRPEIDALAALAGLEVHVLHYHHDSPFCIVDLPSNDAAKAFISRAILCMSIYEWWGSGGDYEALHASVRTNAFAALAKYRDASFKFAVDSFRGKRTMSKQRELIESFAWFDWQGPIIMHDAEVQMVIFEDWDRGPTSAKGPPDPKMLHLGRWLGSGLRDAILTYDLKKRKYISRTSMDAELSLVTALLTLAAPGKIIYDPFVGTGSFAVTAAFFGSKVFGSDIDARSIRGVPDCNLLTNFVQYQSQHNFLDSFISDLVHTPLRRAQILDGIICDPPYGIREGPKTLGYREGKTAAPVTIDDIPAHMRDGWVPPKRPYGFDDMMQDVLDFGFDMLVDHGRLSVWMPTANDEDSDLPVPSHPGLAIISICTQHFNKWSRRLLTYRRLPHSEIDLAQINVVRSERAKGSANDVNRFRKKYFEGFRT